jgi:hypothetical protein
VISTTSSLQNCAGRGSTGIAFQFDGALVIKPARSACTREESERYRHAPPFCVGGLAALGNCLPSSIRWVRLPSGAPFCRRCGKQTHVGSGRRARRPWPLASRCSARSDKQFHPGMAEQQLRRAVDAPAQRPTEVRVLLPGPRACSSKSEHAADNRGTTARYRTCPPLSSQGDAASAGSHKPGTLVQLRPLHPISRVPRSERRNGLQNQFGWVQLPGDPPWTFGEASAHAPLKTERSPRATGSVHHFCRNVGH